MSRPLRIFYMANNVVGWRVLHWLGQRGKEEVVGLVLHPAAKRTYGDEILSAADVPPDRVFQADLLGRAETLETIRALRPDIGLSVFFGYLLRRPLLDLFPLGCLNLHPAWLPYNRGAHPNVWSIVEGTPAGVTLHYMDEGVDTGDIVARRRIQVRPTDTGETLYHRLEDACVELFRRTWPRVRSGTTPRIPQEGPGTFHRVRDLQRLDAIEPDRAYTACELIDRIRARTFPPHRGVYVERDGRRIYLKLELVEDGASSRSSPDGASRRRRAAARARAARSPAARAR